MAAPDLSMFPNMDIPSSLSADQTSDELDTGAQMIPFPFCLLFGGRSWQSITVAAPSPELAATTINQFVQMINGKLVVMGYPPNMCSWNSGGCN
jgi:hypothetical protein